MSDIYYQRQIGDLCRLCSLNSYSGYEKFSVQNFFDYCDEYDSIINGLKSRNMDGFAEGRSIVSYILDKEFNKFTLLIPINTYNTARNHIDINYYKTLIKNKNGICCYFEFNKNHIWLNKKKNGKWYKIDSISGVNQIEPNLNSNGIILVIEDKMLYIEIENYLKTLKKYFENNKIENGSDIPEILLFNLFFSLKQIKISNILKFKLIKRLKEILEIFVNYSRDRTTKNNNKIKISVCNSIKNIIYEIQLN